MSPQTALRRWKYCKRTTTLIAASAALAGCTADPPRAGQSLGEARAADVHGGWESVTLPWGAGSGEVGLRAGTVDFPAQGPSSVAVSTSGDVLVLDRWNERVIGIDGSGVVTSRAAVPSDAEHLAAGPGSVFAAWSPLRGKVDIFARDGASLGQVTVPRELVDTARIQVGISHRIAAVSAYQETVQVGSPRAPLGIAEAGRTRREGAAFLADGRGVAARKTESGGEIMVYRKDTLGDDEKPAVAWTYPLAGPLAAVRVIGASGKAICARVERVTQAEALAVEREVVCVEADSGAVLLQKTLGRPGIAAVHEDLAMGGEPLAIAFIQPTDKGLHVERLALTMPVTASKEVLR